MVVDMETLVASEQGSHQCNTSSGSHLSNGHYCRYPPRGLKGFNCRSFQSGIRILPCSDAPNRSRSSPIPILSKPFIAEDNDELWAGPAYTNSPPPSSLPIPNFSLCRKNGMPVALDGHPLAMSSPSRDAISPPPLVLATWDICRILNLDVGCN